MSAAEKYAKAVIKGDIVAGEFVKLACKRFLADLKRKDIYFDETEANKIIVFAEKYCCLWEDKWRGLPVDVRPWMAFLWQNIYGWYKTEDNTRRFKKVYIQIAKKNAKTTIAGITANFHLFADDRINTPKIFVGANNEDQAKICVNITGKIIEQSPELFSYVDDGTVNLFKYKENIVNIVHKERDGFIKALSKESGDKTSTQSGGKHGINPSLAIVDEYALAAVDDLLNTMESAQAARQEPLLFVITTSGFNKYGPCYQKLRQTGINVLRGTMEDDSYFILIYEHDKIKDADGKDTDDEYKDETMWEKSNPNIGVSVNRDFLRSRIRAAINEGGSKEVDVKTLNFNIWCDAPSVWIQSEILDKNVHGVSLDDLLGQECFLGLYTASSKSLNHAVFYFPEVNGHPCFLCHSWVAEDFALTNDDKIDYQKWIDARYITKTPGNSADYKEISKEIIEMCSKYSVRIAGFDKTFGQYVAPELEEEGIPIMEIFQSYGNLGQQTKEFEDMVIKKQIEYFGNPVLKLHIGNTILHRNSDGIAKPDKGASGHRTGAVSALLNAMVAKYVSTKEGVMDSFNFI